MVWQAGIADDEREAQTDTFRRLAGGDDTIVVPFHLGKKLDGMMSFDAALRRMVKDVGGHVENVDVGPDTTSVWLQRETNRALLRRGADIGVVVLAHGSDFHWNQTMREALAPLHDRYKLEFVFSMADRAAIEAALSRLEQRGVKGAVIVRVFGRGDSFEGAINRMLGLDVEYTVDSSGTGHAHDVAVDRIETPLVVTSIGGLDAHPLFARALMDRVKDLSNDPASETIILVAHGTGDDARNSAWLEQLDRLAERMRNMGGAPYRAIKYATWREDWPDKREAWIERVRNMVREARRDGGTAIVIPARTNGRGREPEFLEGLSFALGEGFAPHPLFAAWVESQIRDGMDDLAAGETAGEVAHVE